MSNISDSSSVYVIAELSANHGGSREHALAMVRHAHACGADAVKIQTYTADTLTLDCDAAPFRIGGGTLWDGQTLHQLYDAAHTPWDWHAAIFAEARGLGLDCFSTPFDETAVDFLESFAPPFYKIASFELTHVPLLRKVAQTRRAVILSTGMASESEIATALKELRDNGCPRVILLKCTSSYPAPAAEANLLRIPDMQRRFGVEVGLSDHTMGLAVPVAAVALGATVIEKHLCFSRSEPGPDSAFSLEPDEFRAMTAAVREAAKARGVATYDRTAAEEKSIVFRRSIFFCRDLPAGATITASDVKIVRPAHGLPPCDWYRVVGSRVREAVSFGTPTSWDLIDSASIQPTSYA